MGTLQQAADATTTRRRSFVQTPTETLRNPSLSDAAYRLYSEIRSYTREAPDGVCFASQERIAADLGWVVSKVRRVAAELLKHGLIMRTRTGRTNRYRLVQSPTDERSDRQESGDPIAGNQAIGSLSRSREEEAVSRRSRSTGEEGAREPGKTTTTTSPPLDAEEAEELAEDTGTLLARLDDLSEKATGRQPRRRPGDWERALALTRYWHGLDDDDGPQVLKPVIWGWGDEWTRSKVLAINGVPTIAQYEGMAARYAAEPKVTCDLCHQPYVPSKRERAAIKSCAAINRQAELTCPRCREDCGL